MVSGNRIQQGGLAVRQDCAMSGRFAGVIACKRGPSLRTPPTHKHSTNMFHLRLCKAIKS